MTMILDIAAVILAATVIVAAALFARIDRCRFAMARQAAGIKPRLSAWVTCVTAAVGGFEPGAAAECLELARRCGDEKSPLPYVQRSVVLYDVFHQALSLERMTDDVREALLAEAAVSEASAQYNSLVREYNELLETMPYSVASRLFRAKPQPPLSM